jgi:hypothetical protein
LVAGVRRFDDHLTTNGRFRKHAVHRQRGLPASTLEEVAVSIEHHARARMTVALRNE